MSSISSTITCFQLFERLDHVTARRPWTVGTFLLMSNNYGR